MPMSGRFLKNLPKRSLSFGVPAIVLLNLLQPCLRASSAVSFSLLCLRLTCADHPAGHCLLASRHDVAPLPTWRHSGGRVHRRERWRTGCAPSKAAKAEAIRTGRQHFFCETNPTHSPLPCRFPPPWSVVEQAATS